MSVRRIEQRQRITSQSEASIFSTQKINAAGLLEYPYPEEGENTFYEIIDQEAYIPALYPVGIREETKSSSMTTRTPPHCLYAEGSRAFVGTMVVA